MATKIDFDPYAVLGLKLGESFHHVKKAYRHLAKKCHPDKAKPEEKEKAEQAFHKLQKAYDFLADEQQKEEYDRHGAAKLIRQEAQEKKKAQSSATRRRFVDELEKTETEFVIKKSKPSGPKDYNEMTEKEKNAFRAMNNEALDQFNASMKKTAFHKEAHTHHTTKHASTGYSDLQAAEDDILGDLL